MVITNEELDKLAYFTTNLTNGDEKQGFSGEAQEMIFQAGKVQATARIMDFILDMRNNNE